MLDVVFPGEGHRKLRLWDACTEPQEMLAFPRNGGEE
jgi:hypothetical protein